MCLWTLETTQLLQCWPHTHTHSVLKEAIPYEKQSLLALISWLENKGTLSDFLGRPEILQIPKRHDLGRSSRRSTNIARTCGACSLLAQLTLTQGCVFLKGGPFDDAQTVARDHLTLYTESLSNERHDSAEDANFTQEKSNCSY